MEGLKIDNRDIIINELLKLNYNIGSIGTVYLIEIIEYLDSKKDYLERLKKLNSTTYPIIANKLGIKIDTLKSNIQKATIAANSQRINDEIDHLTPKTTISYILAKIKSKERKYIF